MRWALIAILFTCAGCFRPAQNSCTFIMSEGQRVHWHEMPIVLGIHSSMPTYLKPAIYSAADSWNVAIGRTLFVITESPVPNQIYFMNTWDTNRMREEARTTVYWTGNRIYRSDVYVNNSTFAFYYGTGYGVEFKSLMIHELGHVLGLGHSTSVMVPQLGYNDQRWDISPELISNVHCEY